MYRLHDKDSATHFKWIIQIERYHTTARRLRTLDCDFPAAVKFRISTAKGYNMILANKRYQSFISDQAVRPRERMIKVKR